MLAWEFINHRNAMYSLIDSWSLATAPDLRVVGWLKCEFLHLHEDEWWRASLSPALEQLHPSFIQWESVTLSKSIHLPWKPHSRLFKTFPHPISFSFLQVAILRWASVLKVLGNQDGYQRLDFGIPSILDTLLFCICHHKYLLVLVVFLESGTLFSICQEGYSDCFWIF